MVERPFAKVGPYMVADFLGINEELYIVSDLAFSRSLYMFRIYMANRFSFGCRVPDSLEILIDEHSTVAAVGGFAVRSAISHYDIIGRHSDPSGLIFHASRFRVCHRGCKAGAGIEKDDYQKGNDNVFDVPHKNN